MTLAADAAPHRVVVVAAVIVRDDRFLLTRRQKGVHLEGLWEFPGGKTEDGETHRAALRRELREELDTDADVQDLVFEITHDYGDRLIALHFYRCVLSGDPRPRLGQEMQWVPRSELPLLAFPPADAELITLLTESGVR